MTTGFGIELHHSPITLYEIVNTVMNKHLDKNGYYKSFAVAEEVCVLHYDLKIGLVPLNPTAHELHHSGELPIHPSLVKGNYNIFLDEYKDYLPESLVNKLIDLEDQKEENVVYPRILMRSENKFIQKETISLENVDIAKLLIEKRMQMLEDIS
jgi:hypothetical protein